MYIDLGGSQAGKERTNPSTQVISKKFECTPIIFETEILRQGNLQRKINRLR